MQKRQIFEQCELTEPLTSSSLLQRSKLSTANTIPRSKAVKRLFSSGQKNNHHPLSSLEQPQSAPKKRKQNQPKGLDATEHDPQRSSSKVNASCIKFKTKRQLGYKQFELKIKQTHPKQFVTPRRRIILIDWLSEVAAELSISKQALHMAVYYIDKIVVQISIPKNEYQYLGIACLFLSHKLDSRKTISLEVASSLVEGSLSSCAFGELEQKVMQILKFKLNPFTFWKEMNMVLGGFQLYLTHQNAQLQGWEKIKRKVLWMSEGIILQLSYSDIQSSQTSICLTALLMVLEATADNKQTILGIFQKYCKNVLGHSCPLPDTFFEDKIRVWLEGSCGCAEEFCLESYHGELRRLVSGCMISM